MDHEHETEQTWRIFLTTGEVQNERVQRPIFKLLPGFPRYSFCGAPFRGLGSVITKNVYGKRPSNLNLCDFCEQFAVQNRGGAEVELSLLFADVRGSTALAETMSPTEFDRQSWSM